MNKYTTNLSFLKEQNTNSQMLASIPMGKYAGILIRISGTDLAAVSLSDITATVMLNVNGIQIADAYFKDLAALNNYFLGYPEKTEGLTFAFSAILPIPFEAGNATLTIDNINSTTTINVETYTIQNMDFAYSGKISKISQSINGQEQFNFTGLTHLFIIPTTASNVSRIQLTEKLSNVLLTSAPYEVLKPLSDMLFNIEDTETGLLLKIADTPTDIQLIIETSASDNIRLVPLAQSAKVIQSSIAPVTRPIEDVNPPSSELP